MLYIGNHCIKADSEISGDYTIKTGTKTIADSAFINCESPIRISILPGSVTSIGNSAFYSCDSLTNVTIPDSVTSIGDSAFSYCDSLTSITIPDSVTSIGDGAFDDCDSLTSITVDSDNPNYSSENGVLFNKDKTELIQYPAGKTDATYTIPDSVTSIGNSAFSSCDSPTSITIPDSVTSIGNSAFHDCDSLTSITIPDSVTSIGDRAFSNCNLLTSVAIGNSVTSIGNYAFYLCDSLTSVTLGNSVMSIGDRAFEYCSSLTSITIPDSMTHIGISAFEDCDSLTSITIPDSVMSIGDGAFYDCNSLTIVTIPNSVTSIGDDAFYGDDHLTIYGYAGSRAETYALDNDIPFYAIGLIEDTQTGVSVAGSSAGVLPDNTQLVVEQIEVTDTGVTYDITLTQNGAAIQPTGAVTVKIPVPETMDGNACKVYRQEADGTYTDMNAVYQDGYMVFTTDHFSQYVLTTETLNTAVLGDVNGDNKVDAVDARWVLQAAAGMRTLENTAAADVNADGKIDAVDARWILQAAAGMRTLGA